MAYGVWRMAYSVEVQGLRGARAHRAADDKGLSGLEAVHAREDINRVGAEDYQEAHVSLVQDPELEDVHAHDLPEGLGHHHRGPPAVGHEQRQGGHHRHHQLGAPRNVEHIVGEAEEHHKADGGEGSVVLHMPVVSERLVGPEVELLEEDDAHKVHHPARKPQRLGHFLCPLGGSHLKEVKPTHAPPEGEPRHAGDEVNGREES
mmetsp:Transcript_47671/g.152794  ORF Transcript_47671/g.152794 Transcript_47671/m.152794 type:complete len:204 (-) Transcript_47671:280-891(-)